MFKIQKTDSDGVRSASKSFESFAAPLNAQVVLREAILSCVTPDRSRLPLLDAYVPWIKTNDFVRAP
jgi:hypothetical protein